ncbi:uncharacterized protein LOC113874452 [Abrus precatorius]|uniref:Uncharacterized protein LOC113874452 n=1 Tax=Abrus precatorius TaxID=3816 RepID=A0A8B8MIR9_ABRPR|nr:uncharacterized protein LOC113874452 [Abrus precatorius]
MAQLLRVQIAILFALIALTVFASARPGRTFIISFSFPSNSSTVAGFTENHSFIPRHTVSDGAPSASNFTSVRDRIKGILSIVGGFTDSFIPRHTVSDGAPSAYDFTSFRDRINDILSILAAIFLALACGAFSIGIVYMLATFY